MTELTPAQGRVLLHKFNTGDFPRHDWRTIEALLNGGYLTCNYSKRIDVTPQGKAWCFANHLNHLYQPIKDAGGDAEVNSLGADRRKHSK